MFSQSHPLLSKGKCFLIYETSMLMLDDIISVRGIPLSKSWTMKMKGCIFLSV